MSIGDAPLARFAGPQPLHPAVRWAWLIDAVIGVAGIAAAAASLELLAIGREDLPWPIPTGTALATIAAAALLLTHWARRYGRWSWQLREHDLEIVSGVWWRVRRCIPRSRVQHVDIQSGPLGRLFGLTEVRLFVAGGMGAVAVIPGLSPATAEMLKEGLLGPADRDL